jgi:di/tricarboxylate transporter
MAESLSCSAALAALLESRLEQLREVAPRNAAALDADPALMAQARRVIAGSDFAHAALVRDLPAAGQLALFMTFAALMTNFVSNAAAASIGAPVAVETARLLGVPVEPFVLAILFGANLSFATPMAYQTHMLVMKAAGYRFTDFVRVGVPLVILMLAVLSWALVRRYGL